MKSNSTGNIKYKILEMLLVMVKRMRKAEEFRNKDIANSNMRNHSQSGQTCWTKQHLSGLGVMWL